MKHFRLKPWIREGGNLRIAVVGILSVLGISASLLLLGDQTVYLPLVKKQYPLPTVTATGTTTPTPTITPTSGPTPTQSGTPHPAGTLWLVVNPENPSKDWALAYFAKTYNNAGRPVMEIYPSDSSPASERIKIPAGEYVLAYEGIVLADGGGRFWKLVDYQGRNGEELYLRKEDVTQIGLLNIPAEGLN